MFALIFRNDWKRSGLTVRRDEEELFRDKHFHTKKRMVGERLEPFLTGGDQGGGFLPYHWRAP
jgi:hypothetical protein